MRPLSLEERISVANASHLVGLQEIERMHRQTSLLRRSRFGLDLSPYANSDLYTDVVGRQTLLSEHRLGCLKQRTRPADLPKRSPSVRSFRQVESIDYEVLDSFLLHAYVRDAATGHKPHGSAGGLYPMHAIILPMIPFENAPFCSDAILHLAAHEGAIYELRETGAQAAAVACFDGSLGCEPNTFKGAAFIVVYVLDAELAALRYAQRGYRFGLIEAGLMAQQATLVAQAMNLGTCLYGGYPDGELAACLDLHPTKMLPCLVRVCACIARTCVV
jgi:SagB-type dehydrogenase family enzyme